MIDGVIAGLASGTAYAILAVCIVVLHRLVGVVNFAQAALGAFGAYLCYALAGAGMPLAPAALAGIAAAAVIAGFVGWVTARWFGGPGTTERVVVSVVLLIVLLTAGFRLFGDSPRVMPSLLPDVVFTVAGVRIALTTVVALALAVVIAAGVSLMLRHTHLGIRMQAMSERPVTVQLLRVNARALSIGAWAGTGAVSTLALLLVAPARNQTFESMSFLVIPALAAALLGGFANIWVAAAGGLAIGAIEGAAARIEGLANYRGALPFLLIAIALIWMRRRKVWDDAR
ncbi:MAG: branched-chain amino acid ABC transporter permease [Microbacteriaceae bacterium]|nr:branched-chain amino acid ABC transporter permease [Microbacteriaceae bacterium]HPZ35082.1 branched-chain amino acid ABC transporter permease [Microbacteriaceae bacterium]HQC92470.1 branched-chain amino acid ABC transporter permease [Microbacteriaceae bacterium]